MKKVKVTVQVLEESTTNESDPETTVTAYPYEKEMSDEEIYKLLTMIESIIG